MRHSIWAAGILAVGLAVTTHVWAQRGEERRESGSPMARELATMAEQLKLTPEQKSALAETAAQYQKAIATWEEQNRDRLANAREEISKAERAGDREAARQVMEQARQLQAERAQAETDFRNAIVAILTPEQRAEYAGLKMLQEREFQFLLQELKPSPEQEAQLKEKAKAYGAALATWEAEHAEEIRETEKQINELMARLRPLREQREKLAVEHRLAIFALLTPEQKTALAVGRLRDQMLGRLGRLQLTDDQVAKIKAICESTVTEMKADPGVDPGALEALWQKALPIIREQVLTDEQRQQVDQRR